MNKNIDYEKTAWLYKPMSVKYLLATAEDKISYNEWLIDSDHYDDWSWGVWCISKVCNALEDYVNWLLKKGYITEADLYYKEA